MRLFQRILSALGLMSATVEAVPTKSDVALPAPAVPKRSYSLPTHNWAAAFARPVEWAPRTKPVRNRAYRRMRLRLRANDRADLRRVRSLERRDSVVWAASEFSTRCCEKPLSREEWRWIERQADKDGTTGDIARLLLDWNGR